MKKEYCEDCVKLEDKYGFNEIAVCRKCNHLYNKECSCWTEEDIISMCVKNL